MTTKDTALRLALEALEEAVNYTSCPSWSPSMTEECDAAATACREALAQPAGEPPTSRGADRYFYEAGYNAGKRAALLSADAQPSEWVGLTEDEANALWESTDSDWELMKRTEKFLREKNARKDMPAADDKAGGDPTCLPCCGYEDGAAIKWNPHNGAVQCHNCGQVYTRPQPQADEPVVLAGLTKDEIWTRCCAEWRGKCDTATACYTRPQSQGGK